MTQSACADKPTATHITHATHAPGQVTATQTHDSGARAVWHSTGATLAEWMLADSTPMVVPNSAANTFARESRDWSYRGQLIGPVANRTANARYSVDGKTVQLEPNDGGPDNSRHRLHGGPVPWGTLPGFAFESDDGALVMAAQDGPHPQLGVSFDITARAELDADSLTITHVVTADAPTPVATTQHTYFNPSGRFDRPVDTLTLQILGDGYTEVDDTLIPTGRTLPVAGTPLDYREPRPIGATEIDHNFPIPGDGMRPMVRLSDGTRTLTVWSDFPGVQIYSGEVLGGEGFAARGGLAIEPQYPPDAVNQPVDGEDTILRPGETYRHTIRYTVADEALRP